MARVFVSYNHQQGGWVLDRLVPVLKAGGADVLIDVERFRLGRAVVGEMDATQDQAEQHVLCLSAEYFASPYCQHEMARAIARDPAFANGVVVPLRLDATPLPATISGPDPLYADFRDDTKPEPWDRLLASLGFGLGVAAPAWLAARDNCRTYLGRADSVDLWVRGHGIAWRPMIAQLKETLAPHFGILDLQDPRTTTRPGLLRCLLASIGVPAGLPNNRDDLAAFGDRIEALPRWVTIAVENFDLLPRRFAGDLNLFTTLRWAIMEKRKIVLLAQSHGGFANLIPRDNPLSPLVIHTVELA